MSKYFFIGLLVYTWANCGCKHNAVKDAWFKLPTDTIVNGRFISPPYAFGGSGITLNRNQTYKHYWGSCLSSGSDSGFYRIQNDTIYFQSLVAENVDSTNQGHDQITPITHKKFLYRNDKIYFYFDEPVYDTAAYWSREKQR